MPVDFVFSGCGQVELDNHASDVNLGDIDIGQWETACGAAIDTELEQVNRDGRPEGVGVANEVDLDCAESDLIEGEAIQEHIDAEKREVNTDRDSLSPKCEVASEGQEVTKDGAP